MSKALLISVTGDSHVESVSVGIPALDHKVIAVTMTSVVGVEM